MKINNIFKSAVFALAVGTVAGVTSCNYLDVVPPEQPGLEDAMKTHATAQGFLYSCYAGLTDINTLGAEYQGNAFNGSTDEWVMPNEQEASYGAHFAAAKNTQTTSLSNICHLWGSMYHYIGQCLLFESQLKTLGRENQVTESDAEEREWLAETRFLKAFYHYQLMRVYGPVPLTTERIPMDLDASEYGGRYHIDYLANYLANEFDLAAADLPLTRESNEFGRATKVIAKAMKARLLLLVASPLYNGEFPYPDWKNPNFVTDGYGNELVSHTYSRKKWEKAYEAVDDAISVAEQAGHSLMTDYNEESNVTLASMDWVPVDIADATEKENFLRKVMLNRYIHSTSQSENPEILWSLRRAKALLEPARMPLHFLKNPNGTWYDGSWAVINPTLNTAVNFLLMDGSLPGQNQRNDENLDFPTPNEWYNPMSNAPAGHEDMINLVRNRDPRFYAWIAFDGGNYLSRIANGQPLTLDLKKAEKNGRQSMTSKNYASTGFLSMKHLAPQTSVAPSGTGFATSHGTDMPTVLCRLSELYLMRAECAAWLATDNKYESGDAFYQQLAMADINMIRQRAGVGELTEAQIGSTYTDPCSGRTKEMTLTQWARQERFIELWDEGFRYSDIRRWVAGPEYLGPGVRQGLNGGAMNADMATFNTPKTINETFTFGTRQYLYPIFINEVYKNPQMIQAPGF